MVKKYKQVAIIIENTCETLFFFFPFSFLFFEEKQFPSLAGSLFFVLISVVVCFAEVAARNGNKREKEGTPSGAAMWYSKPQTPKAMSNKYRRDKYTSYAEGRANLLAS